MLHVEEVLLHQACGFIPSLHFCPITELGQSVVNMLKTTIESGYQHRLDYHIIREHVGRALE